MKAFGMSRSLHPILIACVISVLIAAVFAGKSRSSSIPAGPNLHRLKLKLERYVGWQQGRYGIYLIDLHSGERFGLGGDQVFPAASTYKIPIAMYVLHQIVQGKARLDEAIVYTRQDWDPGEGVLHGTVPGKAFSVAALIDLMIRQSDNIARNMLLRRFGEEEVYGYAKRLGARTPPLDPKTAGTTPREMAELMEQLYAGVIPDEALSGGLLDLLSTTRFHNRIAAGVPRGIKVAHKIGTRPAMVHDIGLVFVPARPFILTVFSSGVEANRAEQVIQQVTRLVYWEFQGHTGRGGRTGPGSLETERPSTPVEGLSNVVAITAGYFHAMALDEEGRPWMPGRRFRSC